MTTLSPHPTSLLPIHDAGLLSYRTAWDLQLTLHDQVLASHYPHGILMLVEHPPVITIGRRQNAQRHLLAPPALLASRNIDFVETDRGGDITFHGPGQLVAYPLLPLNTYHLNLHAYMRLLEQVIISTLAPFGISAQRDPSSTPATGVWVQTPTALAKIAAIGIKVRRWVTLHGLALNVTTDLSCFDLINPCGLSRPVTSVEKCLPGNCPNMAAVKVALVQSFQTLLSASSPQP